MRPLPSALFLISVITAWAAPPLVVTVDSAAYLSGPGKEPPPGSAPFQPRIQGQVTVKGLRPGAVPVFRVWVAPVTSLKGLRSGRLIPPGSPGFTRVEGPVNPLGAGGTYRILAPANTTGTSQDCLIVEVLLRGRWAGRGTAPLLELNLPRTSRPGEPEMKP